LTKILKGGPVRKAYMRELEDRRRALPRAPKLLILSDGEPDSEVYRRSIERLAHRLNVELVSALHECDGLIQLGRPQIEDVPPEKDVEGISEYHIGRLAYGRPLYLPPTPAAALKLLKFYGYPLRGVDVVVIGRSVRVGKPLALMLLNEDATPTVAHTKTADLQRITREAKIVFLSAGVGNRFGREYFSPESVVVDIATVSFNGGIVGDARYDELLDYVEAITPVPGGVGKITPLVLFDNLFRAVERSGETP